MKATRPPGPSQVAEIAAVSKDLPGSEAQTLHPRPWEHHFSLSTLPRSSPSRTSGPTVPSPPAAAQLLSEGRLPGGHMSP